MISNCGMTNVTHVNLRDYLAISELSAMLYIVWHAQYNLQCLRSCSRCGRAFSKVRLRTTLTPAHATHAFKFLTILQMKQQCAAKQT